MSGKHVPLSAALVDYIERCHSQSEDPLLLELREETQSLGDICIMQITPEQGTFLSLLVGALGVKRPIEIGTFTGYSAICLAKPLSDGGKLLCLDSSEEWTSLARKYWEKAGVLERIDLRLGDAEESLQAVPEEEVFDFAFIDADKTRYDAYFELLLPRLVKGSVMVFDNMLWGGRVFPEPVVEPDARAINALNRKLACDRRVESVLLPVADGLNICRKL